MRRSVVVKKLQKAIWPKRGFRRAALYQLHRLSRLSATPHSIALGFAAGTFVSFTPLMGFHLLLAAALTLVFRGNIVASAVGTLIGNPFTFPFIWFASYNLGAVFLGEKAKSEIEIAALDDSLAQVGPLTWAESLTNSLSPLFWPMMAGGIPLGILAGALCYWIIRWAVTALKSQRRRRLMAGTTEAAKG